MKRVGAVLLAFVLAMLLGVPSASAGQNGAPVYNYGPVGVGIDITGDGRYDYVLVPGVWSPSNSKGMYVGPGFCVDVFYDGRYVWTGGQGTHSFLWWWNYRIYLAPRRC